MSATAPVGPGPATAAGQPPEPERCRACGAAMRPDQEWCLQCGVARTILHRPPDWRFAAGVVGVIMVGALVAVLVALSNLGGSASPTPAAAGAGTGTGAQHPKTAGSPARTSVSIATWPPGLSGWTVVLATEPTAADARGAARALAGSGLSVGVLDSDQHPHMAPGSFDVFDGRWPNRTGAERAAAALAAHGHPTATAVQVARPGGV